MKSLRMTRGLFLATATLAILASCQKTEDAVQFSTTETYFEDSHDHSQSDIEHNEHGEDVQDFMVEQLGCIKPTASQVSPVNSGNLKKQQFLDSCYKQTNNSPWCKQLIRPNPSSKNTFSCTYGAKQVHQLIHPTESTWVYPIRGVQLVQHLIQKGIRVCEIYNWWRPEPYNKNVGGAAGRHPFGTSIDVRFCSDKEAILAFNELCKLRKKGHIRAIGYYGSSSLHLGVGDKTANTWGKTCPI